MPEWVEVESLHIWFPLGFLLCNPDPSLLLSFMDDYYLIYVNLLLLLIMGVINPSLSWVQLNWIKSLDFFNPFDFFGWFISSSIPINSIFLIIETHRSLIFLSSLSGINSSNSISNPRLSLCIESCVKLRECIGEYNCAPRLHRISFSKQWFVYHGTTSSKVLIVLLFYI